MGKQRASQGKSSVMGKLQRAACAARYLGGASDLERRCDGLRQGQHLKRRPVGDGSHGGWAGVGDPEVPAPGEGVVWGVVWVWASVEGDGQANLKRRWWRAAAA